MKYFSRIYTQNDLHGVVQEIIQSCKDVQVITLQGSLGAGKTTLAIELLKQLGVQGEMQSPTYTYMQIYRNDFGKDFYHFDLYRLPDKQAFLFAGFDEFLYQPNALVIIEWPAIINDLLDHAVCAVDIEYIDDKTRRIHWQIK
ncbi:MAG: tRNA (adenosine(37)-N6)-threonylcarbamoyltransferase complex ATPase subunit type 1 TsaE [Candidatus Chromulinivorax sp.]